MTPRRPPVKGNAAFPHPPTIRPLPPSPPFGLAVGLLFGRRIVVMQPIAADDVATLLTDIVVSKPVNGMIELAGPEPIRMDDLARRFLKGTGDARQVTTDPTA